MSTSPKKGFSAFLRPIPEPAPEVATPSTAASEPPALPPVAVAPAGAPAAPPVPVPTERIRTVTPTGRVRTHSANRLQPGVTFRLTEERWERLKMLSIQERRPIQESSVMPWTHI